MCLRLPSFKQASLIFQTSQTTCAWVVLDSFLIAFSYSQKTLLRVEILREVEAVTAVMLKGPVERPVPGVF